MMVNHNAFYRQGKDWRALVRNHARRTAIQKDEQIKLFGNEPTVPRGKIKQRQQSRHRKQPHSGPPSQHDHPKIKQGHHRKRPQGMVRRQQKS